MKIYMFNYMCDPNGFDFSNPRIVSKIPDEIQLFWEHDDNYSLLSHVEIGKVKNIKREGPLLVGDYELTELTDQMKEVLDNIRFVNVSIEAEVDMERWPYVDEFSLTGVAVVKYGACSEANGCYLQYGDTMSTEVDNLKQEIKEMKKRLEMHGMDNSLELNTANFSKEQLSEVETAFKRQQATVIPASTSQNPSLEFKNGKFCMDFNKRKELIKR